MSTTIDSLQIEIKSSSTNAASGIDSLAASLEKLKKNGSFKTVSTNLNNLSGALKNLPNVHSASNSLRTLANSIEKLKGVGSISSISNSLAKLPTALKSLSSIDLTKTKTQLEGVADAVSPLSSIKAGGLSTMVNSLMKLDKVAESLDETKIGEFAKKVELLTQKLSPLSEKMKTISAGFKSINSSAKSAERSVGDFNTEVDTSALNLSSYATIIDSVANVVQKLITQFSTFVEQAIEWDGIAARFGRSFGASAQETYDWIQRLNDEMNINVQQFMQYSSLYAQMLTGFGVASEDASKMALGYTELTYDIWASANDRYKSFADAAEAVASAIAGEVEPIRRAGFTIIESTLQQTAANHGLDISIANATEAQKSYLRYLTLVDQAHSTGTIGVYAAELKTAEGMVRTFKQQLTSLTQAVGSLFLPILVKVMPYLQAFVELLEEGVRWIAGLFGVEIQDIGDTWGSFNAGVSDATTNTEGVTGALNDATQAAKELKNATLGIDELNVISPPSSSAGSGGVGGSGGAGSDGFAGLPIDSLWDEAILDGIKSDVDEVKEKIRGWMPVIGAAATALAGLRLVNLIKDLKVIGAAGGLISGAVAAFKFIKEYIMAAIAMAPEVGWFAALFPKISGWFATIGPVIAGAAKTVGTFLAGISAPVWAGIAIAVAAVASAIYFLVENWDKMVKAVKKFYDINIAHRIEGIKKHFDNIIDSLMVFKPEIEGIIEMIKMLPWDMAIDVLATLAEVIGGVVVAILGWATSSVVSVLVGVVEGIVKAVSGAVQAISGAYEFIMALLNGGDIGAAWAKIWDGVLMYIDGMLQTSVIGIIAQFVKATIDWFTTLWDVLVGHSIVPDTINAIVKWFTSLPSKIFKSIDDFVSGIISKFSGLWSKLVSWWNGKTKLKEYTPSIGSIYDKVKSRWDSARTWWNEKKSAMKSYTPSIGSIYEKVYDRWKNARDWWNSKKGSFKTYTPSIGSITDKLKSAWNSAKSWWNKNVKLSTKLNISVPTIKVKWDTASAFGKSFKYPTGFSLKFAANGGIFDQGSLVWAGERGPEVVAKAAGGKTGVMNVQQMQDAVYEGVYSAVVAAMRGQGGGAQEVNVYLDGKQITSAVEKRQRERGASLMGSEVYAY